MGKLHVTFKAGSHTGEQSLSDRRVPRTIPAQGEKGEICKTKLVAAALAKEVLCGNWGKQA